MKPISMALNILQSETNTQMGWLLPTICLLDSKLKKMEASIKVCLPLIYALQKGLQKRFGEFMEDPELISATILLPKFKTSWTDKAHIIKAGKQFLFCSWIQIIWWNWYFMPVLFKIESMENFVILIFNDRSHGYISLIPLVTVPLLYGFMWR